MCGITGFVTLDPYSESPAVIERMTEPIRHRGPDEFAIWNAKRRRLFLARDRLGKKPLYYYWDGRLLAFGSEIKALLAHPRISPEFDDSLLPEYLAFGYNSDERTFFRGIRKLMPGHH